jgi:hypothetical protein
MLIDGVGVAAVAEADIAKVVAESFGAAERVVVPHAVSVMTPATMVQANRGAHDMA